MRRYWTYLKGYHSALLLAPIFGVLDVLCEVFQPRLMSKVIDEGVLKGDIQYIYKMGALMIALAMFAVVSSIANVYFSSKVAIGFATNLRSGLFEKIQSFSFRIIDRFSTVSLTNRVTSDVNILQDVFMMSLRLLIRAPLMLTFAIIIAIQIDLGLTAILCISIPVLIAIITVLVKKGIPYFVLSQVKLDQLNKVIQENGVNSRVVKAYVRSAFEMRKFKIANDDLRQVAVKASSIVVLIMPLMQLVMSLTIVATLLFGGMRVMNATIGVGELMSFINYITHILVSLLLLSMTVMSMTRAKASVNRINEVLEAETDVPNLFPNTTARIQQPQIEFKDVYFKYTPEAKYYALYGINLCMPANKTIGIIGGTGSGKTSLVQLIARLYDVDKGDILIDNRSVKAYDLNYLRQTIAIVLQKNELFSGTIEDNLRWGNPSATMDELHMVCKIAQAHDFITQFNDGYQTILGQGGVNLSGGQKQRLCIARALLKKPKILILDDSTSALDTTTEQALVTAINNYMQGITMIKIAHRISSVSMCDQIIVMDDGKIQGIGTHTQLLQVNAIYQDIYQSQQPKLTV